MAKKRDPLGLSAHWHVDCRLESELPEDNVVGTRFLVNLVFASAAVVSVIVAGWLGYRSISLTNGIRSWEQQIANDKADVQEVQRNQQEYNAEAAKIDRAAALIKTPFLISGLLANFGRDIPAGMQVDSIEWSENGLLIGGSVPSVAQFQTYIDALKGNPEIAPLFAEIKQSEFQPSRMEPGRYTFQVTLRQRPVTL